MTDSIPDLPELAGIATYAEAARVGYSVDENVRRLLRFHWVERRLMQILVAHLTSEPVWEVKCALALHQWQGAEHVDWLRRRIAEMRNPVPRLDTPPDSDPTATALDAFLEQVDAASNTDELLVAVYDIAYHELAQAYDHHLAFTNPLVDHPTRRLLAFALADLQDAIEWRGARGTAGVENSRWIRHLLAYLEAAGGIAGDRRIRERGLPEPRTIRHSFHPRRDERFHGQYNFEFPPHVVYSMPDVPA